MTKASARRAGAAGDSRRKHRPHPVPKWLKESEKLDAIARSRCLMVLSVLSGETPVTDAIARSHISRGTYYQLETRALNAMLAALNPIATAAPNALPDLSATRIEALMQRIRTLEQDKRRTQRLLLLTRKSLRAPLTTGRRGRWPASALPGSITSGAKRSSASTGKAKAPPASTPMKAGVSAS
jgi:hypothetical protein